MGNDREALCNVCKKTINLTWNGVSAIKSLSQFTSHQQRIRVRGEQLPMSLFCDGTRTRAKAATSSNSTPPPQQTNAVTSNVTATTAAVDRQQTLLSPTSALRAEVLWCLNTVAHHHSYNSNEGIGELFQNMFTDSNIAKSFACGKDKTAYIIRFGIAPHFKKLLINSVSDAGL